jgi:hypothetical protein
LSIRKHTYKEQEGSHIGVSLETGLYTDTLVKSSDGKEIQVILDTMAAHHFNFVMANLPAGDHFIQVLAEIMSDISSQNVSASAMGPQLGKACLLQ